MKKKSLILLALAALIGVFVKKASSFKRSDWHGLTEAEARSKLDAKLPGRIPDDKRAEMTDKIVAKMRERGAIVDDTDVVEGAVDAIDLRADAGDAAEAIQN